MIHLDLVFGVVILTNVGFEKKKLIGKYKLMNMLRLSKKYKEFTFA
jgi:hypothetical protein